jgi:hypothetical protein
MKTFLTKYKRLTLMVGLLFAVPLLLQAWWFTAGARGQLDAQFDLWRGHYAIHTYGLNVSGREYARLLKDRYGIETHVDAFCIVSKSQIAFANSYNKLSTDAANRRFGHDVFKECREAARLQWEVRRTRMLANKQVPD